MRECVRAKRPRQGGYVSCLRLEGVVGGRERERKKGRLATGATTDVVLLMLTRKKFQPLKNRIKLHWKGRLIPLYDPFSVMVPVKTVQCR